MPRARPRAGSSRRSPPDEPPDDLDPDRIREGLVAAGLPNLWIPKVFVRVPAIPVLGTGKLDLRAIKQLAA